MSLVGARVGHRELVSGGPFWLHPAFIAVLGAMTFNFALCFVNTNITGVGNGYVIASEIAIISAILLYAYPTLDYRRFLIVAGALLYLVALSVARVLLGGGGFDVKPVRDMLIPIAFFMLGAGAGDVKTADRIVQEAVFVVIAVGLFEYFFPGVFTRFFNVARYYIERGAMDAAQAQQSSNLFVSGLRPEGAGGGRNLLPFLGSHRVSSIFLEPVSMGNFGIVVFMWALVRSLAERRMLWMMFASAAVIIIMADSRYGAYFIAACLLLAALPAGIRFVTVAVLPAAGLATVLFLPDALPARFGIENGVIGRIILSGRILGRFDTADWFGLKALDFVTGDSGYAYALGGLGIVGTMIFWVMLLSVKGHNLRFGLFRDLAGAYFALLLCISNSPFTIKTGALLWFLAGVLARGDDAGMRTRPAGNRLGLLRVTACSRPSPDAQSRAAREDADQARNFRAWSEIS